MNIIKTCWVFFLGFFSFFYSKSILDSKLLLKIAQSRQNLHSNKLQCMQGNVRTETLESKTGSLSVIAIQSLCVCILTISTIFPIIKFLERSCCILPISHENAFLLSLSPIFPIHYHEETTQWCHHRCLSTSQGSQLFL